MDHIRSTTLLTLSAFILAFAFQGSRDILALDEDIHTSSTAPTDDLPISYIQSGFNTNTPPMWFCATRERKRLRVQGIARLFDGSEVLNLDIETSTGLRDIRDLSSAMRDVSRKSERFFYGFWSFPRLPGFFWERDIDAQPAEFRSCSLKADGSLWARRPSPPEENESKIKFSGEDLDLTCDAAVDQLLANIARVFRHDGRAVSCVGRLHGFIVLNECMLSSNYQSVWSSNEGEHDVDSPDRVMRLGRKTHKQLFVDNDPYYSFYQPPRRGAPLFSENARDSFVAFARKRGHEYKRLPADRGEFNDDDASVSLPEWVEFVPRDDQRWRVWDEWALDVWSTFIERVAREWTLAQKGNPDFKGVIYFQLPGWYSLPESSREAVTYRYVDEDGALQTRTEILADHPEYDRLNPAVMGTNMDRLMRSPWFAGTIHETTKSILVRAPKGRSLDEHDAFVDNDPRYRHYYMAQGALLRKVCRDNGKLFGVFARSQHCRGHEVLSPEAFARGFDRTITVLEPDIIATIGPWFVDASRLSDEMKSVIPGPGGELEYVWQEKRKGYREQYRRGD